MASYGEFTDQQLIVLLKTGDEIAFNEIYKRHAPLLLYRTSQMLRDSEATKDLIQEIFLSLWSKNGHIREDASLMAYLYVASRNKVLKLIQKGKVRNDYLASLAKYTTEISTSMMDEMDEKELNKIIQKEIENLPPRMKEVFELSRNSNLSHLEIAHQLGISDKTVKKQINKALKILRLKLGSAAPAGMILLALYRK